MNIFEKLASENQFDSFISLDQEPQNDIIEENSENIFERTSKKIQQSEDNSFGFLDTLKDIGQQVISKGISGVTGSYGNVLEAFGLQTPESQITPAQEQRYSSQFDVLEKSRQGERPSFSDLLSLSDEEYPDISRLPTSKEVSKGIKDVTGIGEGETPVGRIAGRGAEFLGEAAALPGGGTKALLSTGGAGIAGQTLRETGAPESLASGTEIVGSILPAVVQGKLVPRGSVAQEIVDAGRKIGLSEKMITPLIQSEKKVATVGKVARKGESTKKLFGQIKEKLGDSYATIKDNPQSKVPLPNSSQINLRKEFGDIRNQLSKTLAPSPDKEAALKYIETSLDTLRNTNVTPEHLINFWQDINKSVKWNSISGGKKALAELKRPVAKVLETVNPQLAKDFEMTNMLYSKYANISKKLKPDFIDSLINKGEILSLPAATLALSQGNPWMLSGLASEFAIRQLGKEMLTNPYFQNIGNKMVKNFNSGSLKGLTELTKQVQEYMQRKHPNEEWEFLNKLN